MIVIVSKRCPVTSFNGFDYGGFPMASVHPCNIILATFKECLAGVQISPADH
jgi:hypothetical protein